MEENNHDIKALKDDYDKHTLESEKEGTPSKEEKDQKDISGAKASPFLHSNFGKIILVLLIIAALVGLVSILMGLKESKACLGNPFTYGAEKIETPQTGGLTCNCFFSNPKFVPFVFDKNNISIIKNEGSTAGLPSLLNFTMEG